jgi:hypothetical protein
VERLRHDRVRGHPLPGAARRLQFQVKPELLTSESTLSFGSNITNCC